MQEVRYHTCAVVASAVSMLLKRFGKEIDAHDAIFRFNSAHFKVAITYKCRL